MPYTALEAPRSEVKRVTIPLATGLRTRACKCAEAQGKHLFEFLIDAIAEHVANTEAKPVHPHKALNRAA